MKRSGATKFPQSVQLFKFSQKVMQENQTAKVKDQDVGAVLGFNPSDCSHWKRGEKNVKSVFSLVKLSETLKVEPSLIQDIASGLVDLEEAYYEYRFSKVLNKNLEKLRENNSEIQEIRKRVIAFTDGLLDQAGFKTAPLYIPEIMQQFSYITTQPVEMVDKLSRILKIKEGKYTIQYRRGDLKSQTRMSIIAELARILFETERERFPELGIRNQETIVLEKVLFITNLLSPRTQLIQELTLVDSRKNITTELATMFWVPKALINFQLREQTAYGMHVDKIEREQTAINQI